MARKVRRVEVYVVLASDFEAMQFLATLGRLRVERGWRKTIIANVEYKFGQSNRVVEVKARYSFMSWRNIGEIRGRLQCHNPIELLVYCPNEDIEHTDDKPEKKRRKHKRPTKRRK